MSVAALSLFAIGALAHTQHLSSSPGGAVPLGIQAPSVAGFGKPTIQPSRGGLAVCVSGIVNVTASTTQNLRLNVQIPANQSDLTNTILEYVAPGSPFAANLVQGTQEAGGTYEIGATLCTPADNTSPDGVQLLTHGIGFDRHYWDFAAGYSYVDVAVANGYATLSYDRLGVGASTKADPLTELQASLEIEIAASLARLLRAGSLANTTFSTVVGTGHSFGSVISQAVTRLYPDLFDAAILTGYTTNGTALPAFLLGINVQIASENQPYRFSGLSNGYIVGGTTSNNQIGFFRAPNFDPAILAAADAGKGTTSYGEFFTLTAVTAPAANYTGSVAVVNGDADLPFCFGNCTTPTDLTAAVLPALYPNLDQNKTGTYIAPLTGHGLNLHYTAVAAYEYIQKFLKDQGL
ncbi:hypothetical protein CAC42_7768 [Sphaceloma murrayae]|uniref:AB hydrolase-1 domain-containing protein n=1 Tax=Sphaceloma murrayae TaxID=2082308 RepID=A0A2K1QXM5_9PEZI|nr:hypothetical protein CAC42_7768 [Sphaceloma murrayae]